MDPFVGTWKVKSSSKNYSEYLKAVGVGCCGRMQCCKPTTTISVKGEKKDNVTIKEEGSCKKTEVTFPLEHEFEDTTYDNRDVKSYAALQEGKLRMVQKWDDKQSCVIREIKDGQLIQTLTMGKLVATRTYNKSIKKESKKDSKKDTKKDANKDANKDTNKDTKKAS